MQLGKLYICYEFKTGSSTASEAPEEKTENPFSLLLGIVIL